MPLDLCLCCSGDTYVLSSKSEKPIAPFTTPCCGRGICASCISKNRRLKEYCILCSTPIAATSGSNTPALAKEEQFVIGLDDDDDLVAPEVDERLPSYEQIEEKRIVGDEKNEKEEKQTAIHYIQPTETLQGIALSYGISARLLVQQNKLPSAILSTQPSLLHTRTFLVLPPGCKASVSPTPVRDEAEERRRLLVRHFQMKTKCTDPKVANFYINQVYENRTKEAECIRLNRQARGLDTVIDENELTRGGELDEAIEAYETDLQWEKKQANDQKGKFTARFRGMHDIKNSENLIRRRAV